jgi:hypothetical protein
MGKRIGAMLVNNHTALEEELLSYCKTFLDLYESLCEYQDVLLMMLPPDKQLKYLNCKRLIPKLYEVVKK